MTLVVQRPMKTRDISDLWFLQVVDVLSRAPLGIVWPEIDDAGKPQPGTCRMFTLQPIDGSIHWIARWDIERLYGIPEKLVLSKARSLIKRELMEGCDCGCRGDFEITDAGRALLESATLERVLVEEIKKPLDPASQPSARVL